MRLRDRETAATLVSDQVTKSRRSLKRGREGGMMLTLYDDARAACFEYVVTGKNGRQRNEAKRCPHCQRAFIKGELAFVSKELRTVIHSKCVAELSQLVIGGATSNAEAELMLERQRIEETGKFYG